MDNIRIIDWSEFEKFLYDGTGDEIITEVGTLHAETVFEEQGEERTWDQLDKSTQDAAAATMENWALKRGYRLEVDAERCVVCRT